MNHHHLHHYRRLIFALCTMLALLFGQARAADYTAGVANINGAAILWFQGASVTQSIAHYKVAGGAQQNVNMAYNSTRARHELAIQAAVGQTVSYQFTYTKGGLAYDSPWASAVAPSATDSTRVATPAFWPAPGTYAGTQAVTVSSATTGAALHCSINGGASAPCANPITVSATTSIAAFATKSGMSNSATASGTWTIGTSDTGFTHGVTDNGSSLTVWFARSPKSDWVDIHYSLNGGGQQNVDMTYNGARHQVTVPVVAGAPVSLAYSFTYMTATGARDANGLAWTRGTSGGAVAKPVFSPGGGTYSSAQSVRMSSSTAGATIWYSINGGAQQQYNDAAPVSIGSSATLSAVARKAGMSDSPATSASYTINTSGDGAVAAPSLSHASGTYNTRIGVNMLTATPGATVHYTRDGSTPTRTSPQFNGAIWLGKSVESGDTFTLRALATKNGVDSAVVSRTYTIASNAESAWNGMTTFNIVNGTGGKYTDDKVYWLIIGKDWATGQYVRADQTGRLIPVTEADNTVPVPNRDKGYANYGVSLAQARSVTIPAIESARIYLSVGKPVLIQVNRDINGNTGYAGPDLENSTDPNLATTFDFGEFNINRARPASNDPDIYVNTSRVDIFGLPLKLRVTGLDGYDATVGETLLESRDELFARFILETPSQFHGLARAPYAPYRIMAPAHATFNDGLNVRTGEQVKPRGEHSTYLDGYITDVWNKYRNEPLSLKVGSWPQFTGRVGVDDVFTFTDGVDSYKIHGKPTTTEVMLGNGVLDDATGTAPATLKHDKQLQLQAQICAALNRHVADQPSDRWYDGQYFYPTGQPANFYTKFWHDHSINGLAYGFSYDDVGGHSPSIYTPSPVSVTYTIGR